MNILFSLFGNSDSWRRESQEKFGVLAEEAVVLLKPPPAGKENRIGYVALDILADLKQSDEKTLKRRMRAIEKQSQNLIPFKTADTISKNRYNNVFPTSLDLVSLQDGSYIHANRFCNMVVTQAPFIRNEVNTVCDFWKLASEMGDHIVCLTDQYGKEGKSGLEVEKCFPYWLPRLEGEICCREDNLEVKLLNAPQIVVKPNERGECVSRRIFSVKLGEKEKKITQWHFEKWPDHSVCNSEQLARLAHALLQVLGNRIIHCSAGIGRAGVFAVSFVLIQEYLQSGKIPTAEEIDAKVIALRERRPGSVQNTAQLDLISKTIVSYITLFPLL